MSAAKIAASFRSTAGTSTLRLLSATSIAGAIAIGTREATSAATNTVCRRLVDYQGDEPGAAGFRCDDKDPYRLSGGLPITAADADGADPAGAPLADRRSGHPR